MLNVQRDDVLGPKVTHRARTCSRKELFSLCSISLKEAENGDVVDGIPGIKLIRQPEPLITFKSFALITLSLREISTSRQKYKRDRRSL